VHICGNQGHNNETLEIGKLSSDEQSETFNLHLINVKPFRESEWVIFSHFLDSSFGVTTPLDLGNGSDTLTIML